MSTVDMLRAEFDKLTPDERWKVVLRMGDTLMEEYSWPSRITDTALTGAQAMLAVYMEPESPNLVERINGNCLL